MTIPQPKLVTHRGGQRAPEKVHVWDQAGLDAAIAAGDRPWLRGDGTFTVRGDAEVVALNSVTVDAYDHALVDARKEALVIAHRGVRVWLSDWSRTIAVGPAVYVMGQRSKRSLLRLPEDDPAMVDAALRLVQFSPALGLDDVLAAVTALSGRPGPAVRTPEVEE